MSRTASRVFVSLFLFAAASPLAACGPESTSSGDPSRETIGLSVPAGTHLHLRLTIESEVIEDDVHDEGTGEVRRSSADVPVEWWLAPDGSWVEHRTEQGLRREVYASSDGIMRRVGAVTDLVPEAQRGSALAEVEDLVCLLGWAARWPGLETRWTDGTIVVTGERRPERRVADPPESGVASRLESFFQQGGRASVDAEATLEASGSLPIGESEVSVLPNLLVRTVWGRGRRTIIRTSIDSARFVETAPAAPAITSSLAVGEAVPALRARANVVVSEHAGPMTDVPRVVAYVRDGLTSSGASARGRFGLELERLAGETGRASMRVIVPAGLPQDRDAGHLPEGTSVELDPGGSVMHVPCTGPLLRDEADLAAVLDAVRATGAEPEGPMRLLLPDGLLEGEPAELRYVAEVPIADGD